MPALTDPDRLRNLVRQAALTSSLLGVDFVPVFRLPAPAAEQDGESAVVEPKLGAPAPSAPPAASAPARDRAAAQSLLDRVLQWYEADSPHKNFRTDHTKLVFGVGDPCARVMFIGEAPGADEDRLGIPFVGRAGQMLDKWIAAMGLERAAVYIANVLKTRPPNNATPTIDEARLCAPYLFEQIAVIQPEVIVTLGLPATRLLLGTDLSMSQMRGRWARFLYSRPFGVRISGLDTLEVPVLPTYHPAFLLRSYTPENRAKVWDDLQKVMQRLGLPCNRSKPSA